MVVDHSPKADAISTPCPIMDTPTSRPPTDSLVTPTAAINQSQHLQYPPNHQRPQNSKRVKESPTLQLEVMSNLERMMLELTEKVDGHAATAATNFAALRSDQEIHARKVQSLCNEVGVVKETMATVSDEVDKVKADIKTMSAYSTSLAGTQQNQGDQLQQLKQQVSALASQVSKHSTDISECKLQQSEAKEEKNREARNYEIMLRGMPLTGAEKQIDLEGKIVKLAKAINMALTPADIEEAHVIKTRIDGSDKPKMMVVIRLASLKTRRSFFHHYIKNAAKFNTKVLGEPVEERIYATDNLTKKNAEIRRAAGKLKKEGKIHGYSIYKGEVSVVVAEGNRHSRVHSMAELESVVGVSGINDSITSMEI